MLTIQSYTFNCSFDFNLKKKIFFSLSFYNLYTRIILRVIEIITRV